MNIEKSSLKECFEGYEADNKPKNKLNYVGVIKLDRVLHLYHDKKLFRDEDLKKDNPLLFSLYEFASEDINERGELLNSFIVEPEMEISLNIGSFDTLLPPIFLRELIKILNFGLHKEYISKKDDLVFAKGKINIKNQIKNEIRRRPKIACEFEEITTNNFLNQIILRAAVILMNTPKIKNPIKSKLSLCSSKIRQEFVEDVYIGPNDLIKKRNIPRRYNTIISLAKAVIKREHHSIKDNEKVKCPSFMINMATVWESFLRSSIRKRLEKEGWKISKRDQKLNILKPALRGIPDIILEKENKYLILDAKYKPTQNNADLYQICAYLGSKHNSNNPKEGILNGFLLYLGNLEGESDRPKLYKYLVGKEEIPINVLFLWDLININKNDLDEFSKKLCEKIISSIIE